MASEGTSEALYQILDKRYKTEQTHVYMSKITCFGLLLFGSIGVCHDDTTHQITFVCAGDPVATTCVQSFQQRQQSHSSGSTKDTDGDRTVVDDSFHVDKLTSMSC